ncbi:MAG: hypothetical protein ACHQ02_10870, partial [Candidatus Limnocylindrales bacterium]
MRIRLLALVVSSSCVVACGPAASGGGDDSGGDDAVEPDARPYVPGPDAGPAARCEKIDFLFVVDNSGSMGEEQTNLATNFPAFIALIEDSGLDYRVAVTTTGMDYTYQQQLPIGGTIPSSIDGGDNGAMLQPSSCTMAHRWIEGTDTDPSATFACAA